MADRCLPQTDQDIIDYSIPDAIETLFTDFENEVEDENLKKQLSDFSSEILELFERRFD